MHGAKSRRRLARWGIGLDLIFNTEVTEVTENHRANLPPALARKYRHAGKEWNWQWMCNYSGG
jgi:hypothetical protein